jgi:ATPase subunit of ABC transporter with duplicated ATPase domains
MIAFSSVQKQYGKQVIDPDATIQLNPGEKVGLVGPNGAGKTTLFRMIMGEETPRRRRSQRSAPNHYWLFPPGRGGNV